MSNSGNGRRVVPSGTRPVKGGDAHPARKNSQIANIEKKKEGDNCLDMN
jgi:hypothetical protein